jgi:hypothetical protein
MGDLIKDRKHTANLPGLPARGRAVKDGIGGNRSLQGRFRRGIEAVKIFLVLRGMSGFRSRLELALPATSLFQGGGAHCETAFPSMASRTASKSKRMVPWKRMLGIFPSFAHL